MQMEDSQRKFQTGKESLLKMQTKQSSKESKMMEDLLIKVPLSIVIHFAGDLIHHSFTEQFQVGLSEWRILKTNC
jgi:hypothetical protein